MEKLVYASKFIKLYVNEEAKICHASWLEASGDMSEEEFKEIILISLDIIIKNNLRGQLADMRKLSYPVTPDLQKWVYDNVISQYDVSFKAASITPADFFAQLSLEQVQDEFIGSKYQMRTFDNMEEAFNWVTK